MPGNITAISHRFLEAKILSDIKFICQIFFKAKCFSKFNVSQVLTKTSPMGYSIYGSVLMKKNIVAVVSLVSFRSCDIKIDSC